MKRRRWSEDDRKRALRRGMYIIPSFFTVSNIFCGFYSVSSAMRGNYELAGILIGIAMILDTLDGRLARLTHTASEFGVQLDSLADVITFGVAPAMLCYQWAFLNFERHIIDRAGWLAVVFRRVSKRAVKIKRRRGHEVGDRGHAGHVDFDQIRVPKVGRGVEEPVGVVEDDQAALFQVARRDLAASDTRMPIDHDDVVRSAVTGRVDVLLHIEFVRQGAVRGQQRSDDLNEVAVVLDAVDAARDAAPEDRRAAASVLEHRLVAKVHLLEKFDRRVGDPGNRLAAGIDAAHQRGGSQMAILRAQNSIQPERPQPASGHRARRRYRLDDGLQNAFDLRFERDETPALLDEAVQCGGHGDDFSKQI